VQSLIYQDDLAYQPEGQPAVDAGASGPTTFQTKGHARVEDGRIQPAKGNLKELELN